MDEFWKEFWKEMRDWTGVWWALKGIGGTMLFLFVFFFIYGWLRSPHWVEGAGWIVGVSVVVIPVLALVFFAVAPAMALLLRLLNYDGPGLGFGLLLKAIVVFGFIAWVIWRLVT